MKKNIALSIKKAFTLIELLIVVAIIGILAGVGIPMYNGYMADAKINSTKENHLRIKNFIFNELTKCSINPSGKMILGEKTHNCDNNIYSQSRDFYDYFNGGGGFRNPYDKNKGAVKVAKNPLIQGETSIMGVIANQKKYITIKTKIDDGSPLLDDIAIKEY